MRDKEIRRLEAEDINCPGFQPGDRNRVDIVAPR